MKKIIIIFLVITSFVACNRPMEFRNNVTVDVDNWGSINDLYSSYRIIPLDNSKQALMADPSKIKKSNGKYYIEDRNLRSIFVFDTTGRLVVRINRFGRGHGEYGEITDFDIYNDNLFILNNAARNVLKYNLNGDFVCSYDVRTYYDELAVIDSAKMLLFSNYSNDGLFNFVVFDIENECIIEQWDKFDENEDISIGENFLSKCGNAILISKPFDHMVYKYSNNTFDTLFSITFKGCDPIPNKPGIRAKNDKIDPEHKGGCSPELRVITYMAGVTESNGKIYVGYRVPDKKYRLASQLISVDTATFEVHSYDFTRGERSTKFPLSHWTNLSDGCAVDCWDASSIQNLIKWHNINDPILQDIKEDDNYVLVENRLK